MTKLLHRLLACGLVAFITVPLYAEVVVIASAKCHQASLTQEQLGDIYHLKMRDLPGGVHITPLMLNEGAERNAFLSTVLKASNAQMKAYWAKLTFTGKGFPPKAVDNDAEMKRTVAADPGAIGFVDKSALDNSVKVLFTP